MDSIRSQQYADTAQESGDFIEFLGLAGVGQAEASSLTWGDIDWTRKQFALIEYLLPSRSKRSGR